mgnify:CR=1 FL=1
MDYSKQALYTEEFTFSIAYAHMFYYGIMIFGLGELGPKNEIEFMYLYVALISAAIFNALIFGDLTSLVEEIFKAESEL